MKHKLTGLMLTLCLAAPGLRAAEQADAGFWEMLRMKIEALTPQKKLSTTTAVGGVRGAPVAVQDIYWKGEAQVRSVDADELALLQRAIGLVEAGQTEQAKLGFAEFSRNYPDSPLRADADQALARLVLQAR